MSQTSTGSITATDISLLTALNRYTYLTAAQASRLLYPKATGVNRYVRERLVRLVDEKYVLRLRSLPVPSTGSAPYVFTLARKGRQYLGALGMDVPSYYRPSEEQEKARNSPFMEHTLAAIDVLIAADLLCRQLPEINCPTLLTERELKRLTVRVELPARPGGHEGSRKVAVLPDGWFQLSVAGSPPVSISLELDRGTEGQKFWRRKVAALVAWAEGPYRETFQAETLAIAVVTGSPYRRDQLLNWTKAELVTMDRQEMGELFVFVAADPATTPPHSFFLTPVWYCPTENGPIRLLAYPGGEQPAVEEPGSSRDYTEEAVPPAL